jgi:hypothetical protein
MPNKRETKASVHIKTAAEYNAYARLAESLGKTLKPGKNVLGTIIVFVERKTDPVEDQREDENE